MHDTFLAAFQFFVLSLGCNGKLSYCLGGSIELLLDFADLLLDFADLLLDFADLLLDFADLLLDFADLLLDFADLLLDFADLLLDFADLLLQSANALFRICSKVKYLALTFNQAVYLLQTVSQYRL